MANSTKIHNNIYTDGPDISLTKQGYRNTSFRPIDITAAAIEIEKSQASSSTTSTDNTSTSMTDTSTSMTKNDSKPSTPKAARKAVVCKKPVVGRKSITAKKTQEPIKVVSNNCKIKGISVEKILKQINMTKYQQSFKKIDVSKFKDLREIDLNAIGITRASEIRTFMDAIKKTKSEMLVIKQN